MNVMLFLRHMLVVAALACMTSSCGSTRAATTPRAGNTKEVAPSAITEYPEPLIGHWIPVDQSCTTPVNYDSDSLVVIKKALLGRYEDTSRPTQVRLLSADPPVWAITSLLSIGGDRYDAPVNEVFSLGGDQLAITGSHDILHYKKCEETVPFEIAPVGALHDRNAKYPKAMRGVWMLGTEPCDLPINADADGRFVVEDSVIRGYEATYTPVKVTRDPRTPNTWNVTSTEVYLGTQATEIDHSFTLADDNALLERSADYKATYSKCKQG